MSERLYVDANVWIALWNREESATAQGPSSKVAGRLVRTALACKFELVTGNNTLREIKKNFPDFEVIATDAWRDLELHGKFEYYRATLEEWMEAATLNESLRLGFDDCLHLIIAQKTSDRLVTWDERFLREAGRRMNASRPQDLL